MLLVENPVTGGDDPPFDNWRSPLSRDHGPTTMVRTHDHLGSNVIRWSSGRIVSTHDIAV